MLLSTASLLDTNSELVNAFKTYDDMLEQSALHTATSASANDNAPVPQLQETAPAQQQTTTSTREGEGLSAPFLEERTAVKKNYGLVSFPCYQMTLMMAL